MLWANDLSSSMKSSCQLLFLFLTTEMRVKQLPVTTYRHEGRCFLLKSIPRSDEIPLGAFK